MNQNDSERPETTLLGREEVYRGKIVNLRVDTIQHPSGKSAIREVVQHPGGVTVVALRDSGELLLIRQYRYPLQRFILELPAGKLDSGQSPLDTICRELEEEAGFRADTWDYGCAFYTSPGISDELIHLFIARNLSPVPQRLEEGEHITVEAHSLENCLQLMQSGEIRDGKTILGILWYHMKILMKL